MHQDGKQVFIRSGGRIISTSVNRIVRVGEEFGKEEEVGGGLGERLDRQQAEEPVDAEEMSQRVTRSISRGKRENSVGEMVVELLGEGFEMVDEPTDENLSTTTIEEGGEVMEEATAEETPVEDTPLSAPFVEETPASTPSALDTPVSASSVEDTHASTPSASDNPASATSVGNDLAANIDVESVPVSVPEQQ